MTKSIIKKKVGKIGLGGGCHWCTEGIFQSLIGIHKVKQGWIASDGAHNTLSEAIIVHFYPEEIDLKTLIEIHLYTHASTLEHSMREKYRSAIYTFSNKQDTEVHKLVGEFQSLSNNRVITKVLPFRSFKSNQEDYLNYLYSKPESPFCKTYIHPKLSILMKGYSSFINQDRVRQIGIKNHN